MNAIELENNYDLLNQEHPEFLRALSPKRYQVSNPDYLSHKQLVSIDYIQFSSALYKIQSGMGAPAEGAILFNLSKRLTYGAQNYYLSRDLGEALLRTALPNNIGVEDLKFPFPDFRVVLPSNLITLGGVSVPYVDIQLTLPSENQEVQLPFPLEIAKRLPFQPIVQMIGGTISVHTSTVLAEGVCNYTKTAKWEDKTIQDLLNKYQPIEGAFGTVTHEEHQELDRLLVLAINIITFLVALPEEVSDEQMTRAEKYKKGTWREGLWIPRFIGSKFFNTPAHPSDHSNGAKLPSHWCCGHWKRQTHGPANTLRKIIWVQPYRTGITQ